MTADELERNRAVRIAYGHARRGAVDLVETWLELGNRFAPTTPRQHDHAAALLRLASRTIPGQIDIYGEETPEPHRVITRRVKNETAE